jgi:uncharacterized glyoxalase superfamily metalloenzyme YdcJ
MLTHGTVWSPLLFQRDGTSAAALLVQTYLLASTKVQILTEVCCKQVIVGRPPLKESDVLLFLTSVRVIYLQVQFTNLSCC